MPVPELIAGPYLPPACKVGDWIDDEVDGRLEVGGWTVAPISWPRRKKTGRASLILCGDLVRAVQTESSEAVAHWWGVGVTKVWMWRRALGVGRVTDGTRKLLQERTGVPPEAAARGRAAASAPEVVARMTETKRGKPAHPNTKAALLEAAQRPVRPGRRTGLVASLPAAASVEGKWARYTDEEREYIRAHYAHHPAEEIGQKLGRTATAIRNYAERRLGLDARHRFGATDWDPRDDAVLLERHADMGTAWCAKVVKRSEQAVRTRLRSLIGRRGK